MRQRVALALLAAGIVAPTACDDDGGPTGSGEPVAVGVEVELSSSLDVFKVTGRLDVAFQRVLEGAAPLDAGTIVLPAGSRRVEDAVVLPRFRGALLVRERTASAAVPFLTGTSDPFVPREGLLVEIPLVLCSPPDSVPDEDGNLQLVLDPDCPSESAD